MDLGARAVGIGALADDTRRALYEYVVAQREPVGREQAATALDLPAHRANFHLDRLVEEGLLAVEYRRLGGRTGPGAGRPSKLYRRAPGEVSVSLPPRRYELVGEILAAAVTRASEGLELGASLEESAHDAGVGVGRAAGRPGRVARLHDLADLLSALGYEATLRDGEVMLANCPFDALARTHTELVCGLNRSFVQGAVDGLECEHATAQLQPDKDTCCVRVVTSGE